MSIISMWLGELWYAVEYVAERSRSEPPNLTLPESVCSHTRHEGTVAPPSPSIVVSSFHCEPSERRTIDATVSTVRPPAHLGCAVDLCVRNDERGNVEVLHLGVGLGVLEEVEDKLGALLGPATLRPATNVLQLIVTWRDKKRERKKRKRKRGHEERKTK